MSLESTEENSSESSHDRELFDSGKTSRSRLVGMVTVVALLVTGTLTFLLLIGFLPITPDNSMVLGAAAINTVLLLVLLFLIGKDVVRIIRSRQRGRAASRLHVRIIGLFCLVAALPAILVAIVAGITLDLGLDRWFEIRTKKIIESSVDVARAYRNESTRVLMGNTLSMAANLDRNRQLFILDRLGFQQLFTIEARGRGFVAAALVQEDGTEILASGLESQGSMPPPPEKAMELAVSGDPVPIPPGNTNLVGALFKLREIPNAYLYSIIAVQPSVIEALRSTELNSDSYNRLEQNRLPFQLAFAILYLGVCIIVLLCAIWMGMSVANRIVTPIRRLMFAANEVSTGNLDVSVDTRQSEGDLRFLSDTFNVMLTDLRAQQTELLNAKELMDQRARFIEAVLSGVSAAVIGVDANGYITIANKSALPLLGVQEGNLAGGQNLKDRVPELAPVFSRALKSGKDQYHEQIMVARDGQERTLNVQVTVEEESGSSDSYVLTLDDITDLVAAQRNTAWADVARRIAHEIKNPLTPIQLSAERIRRRYGKQIVEDREVFENCTDTIIRQVSDIGRMVDEFSSFARMPAPVMEENDLNKLVKETVFLEKVGFPDIEFTVETDDNPLLIVFDSRMISQALINVMKNAAEAIEAIEGENPRKGKINIRVTQVGGNVEIDVIDNGRGLPETNRQRLLEPYMTTREKGTGLGLAIVRKILEDHNGTIELMDAPDTADGPNGAMMRLRLPMVKKSTAAGDQQKNKKAIKERA